VLTFALVVRTRALTRDWSLSRLTGVSLALTVLSVAIDGWRMAG